MQAANVRNRLYRFCTVLNGIALTIVQIPLHFRVRSFGRFTIKKFLNDIHMK